MSDQKHVLYSFMTLFSWRIVGGVIALLMAAQTCTSELLAFDTIYDNGALIDLVTIRGTKATASSNFQSTSAGEPAAFLLYKVQGALHSDHFGPCWWMMQLPDAYNVAHVRLDLESQASVAFQVKVATEEPEDWSAVPAVASFHGSIPHPNNPQLGSAFVDFPSAKAKFIRIEFSAHEGTQKGGGGPLFILGLQAWGPNFPTVNPAISVAQSTWAGGSCRYHDLSMDKGPDGKVTAAPDQDATGVIDDNDPSAMSGQNNCSFWTQGSPSPAVPQPDEPAIFTVTLKNRMSLSAVAYGSMPEDRGERPRNLKIYTSVLGLGNDWTLQKTLTDEKGGSYVEIPFDQPVTAMRVRFEIDRVWNASLDKTTQMASGIMGQLYAYGNALPPDFVYTSTRNDVQVGAAVFDKQGQPIRNLQLPAPKKAGTYGLVWDGLDDAGNKMPPGDYQCRVVLNPAVYRTVGGIGNTASPTMPQNPPTISSIAADSQGAIYTADSWEELGQDFRKWDRDTGVHVRDDQFRIRNGTPNGLPYAIAVDDKYVYCSTISFGKTQETHVRRFTLSDFILAPFPAGPNISDGHILLHEDIAKEIPAGTPPDVAGIMHTPLRSLAVAGNTLFVTDYLASKVWGFDKTTGAQVGALGIDAPLAVAVDSIGGVWISHGAGQVSVFTLDGKPSVNVLTDLGNVVALAFGPDHLLYVADSAAGKILIYKVDEAKKTAVLQKTFGQKAQPADYVPDRFYDLIGLVVDSQGYLTVAEGLPVIGSRLIRFAPDGKVVWDQIGAEFCNTGNYAQEDPDDVISQNFHRYHVDRKTGHADFRGSVVATDPKYVGNQHSPMRLLTLHGQQFAFQGYGTGLQVYRKDGDVYKLCSMFGSTSPYPDGSSGDNTPEAERPLPGLWSWHDVNGNGKVDNDEIAWAVKPVAGYQFANMGVNVDNQGNALFCPIEGDVSEAPLTSFDGRGNPVYDLTKIHILVPRDTSPKPVLTGPRMAVRADDGTLYVNSQSLVFPGPPEAGPGWMTGWMLARYDKNNKRLWYTRMPETCPGMDYVPGGGVMLVTLKSGPQGNATYQYSTDGMLIGVAHPSDLYVNGGWSDNTGSFSASRDPRSGNVDMFSEDCVENRFKWMQMDDHQKPQIISTWLHLKEPGQPLGVVPGPSTSL